MKRIIISDEEKNKIRHMHESFKENGRVIKEQDDSRPESGINKAIQCFLNKKGIKDNSGKPLEVDGSIGNYPASKSAQAVYKYQKSIGVTADGVWGSETESSMKPGDKDIFNKCKSETGGLLDKVMGFFK
jgi:peptidoglycan hydrolase-like protein with peptidoglycan-binding domain